jgi:hypothetical protein
MRAQPALSCQDICRRTVARCCCWNAGPETDARASLRKFLDWIEIPRWHEARNVTAAEWGKGFPETGWVNTAALQLLHKQPPMLK